MLDNERYLPEIGKWFGAMLVASALSLLPFQAMAQSIKLEKSGPLEAEVGDTIRYSFILTNPEGIELTECFLYDELLEIREVPIEIDDVLEIGYEVVGPNDGPNTLTNTATAICDEELEATAEHSVTLTNLPGTSIELDKNGPSSAQVGDTIDYSFDLTKSGDGAVTNCLLSDLKLGLENQSIEVGVTFHHSYTVQNSDVGQLVNDASVTCEVVDGDPIGATDQHIVSVPDPSVAVIDLEKSGPDVAKIGDTITYDFLLTQTGGPEVFDCVLEDSMLLDDSMEIAVDEPLQLQYQTTEDDGDQLENFATVTCQVEGGGTVEASDDHFVELVNASIALDKSGPSTASVGEEITYAFLLTNTGDSDVNDCMLHDPQLGVDQPIEVDEVLEIPYLTSGTDSDPLRNTATVTCAVGRFEFTVEATDSHTVDLLHPSVELTKLCAPNPAFVGEPIEWTIGVENTGDTDLDCTIEDPDAGVDEDGIILEAGGDPITISADRLVLAEDKPTISNTATASCSVLGFPDHPPVDDLALADCEVWEIREICRSPGFWSTHSGTEKKNSRNLTLDVLAANDSGIEICGLTINNTDLESDSSALEALCVKTEGEQRRQLIRQLTAAALNCIISGSDDSCLGVGVEADFAAANEACANGDGDLSGYIDRIDCFNNGGQSVDQDGQWFCDYDTPGCHERALTESTIWQDENGDPIAGVPGPAGSSKACNTAKKN